MEAVRQVVGQDEGWKMPNVAGKWQCSGGHARIEKGGSVAVQLRARPDRTRDVLGGALLRVLRKTGGGRLGEEVSWASILPRRWLMKLVLPTEYCPMSKTKGLASAGEGRRTRGLRMEFLGAFRLVLCKESFGHLIR